MTDADNDEKRFYGLAWPHMDAVLRTAQCLTHSAADAEDLAQETMLKAFRAIGSVRDDLQVKPWLMTILRRLRIDLVRATKPQESLEDLYYEPARGDACLSERSDGAWHDPEQALNCLGDADLICALRELPREIRWALLLVDVEGMDQRQAALALGVPVGTVKSRLHRGRAMLRAELLSVNDHVLLAG